MSKEEEFKKTLQQLLDEQTFAFEESDWEVAKKVIEGNRRKRRLLPFWFMLGGVVIFTGRLMLWPEAKPVFIDKHQISEQRVTAPRTKAETVSEETKSIKARPTAPALSQSKLAEVSNNATSAPEKQSPKPISTSPLAGVSVSQNAVPDQKEEAVYVAEPLQISENAEVPVVPLISAITTNQSSQENNKGLISTEEKAGDPLATSLPLTALETPSTLPLEEAKTTSNEVVATATALPKDSSELSPAAGSALSLPEIKKNMLWSVEAGCNVLYGWKSPTGTEGRGFNPVLGINYHKAITERIDYSLGLHFTGIHHLGAFSDTSTITKYSFGEERQVTVISPQTFYYLNFPLRFSWNFSKKQSLGSSFELGYLLNVNSTVETYEESFSVGEKQSSKELGYTEGIAPYNFQMGFFYRRELFKNLYIQPEVFFGLVDLKDDAFFNSSVKERSSGLKLSLLYSIKNR
ncbi:MAG: hypothetical protein MUF75_07595 [Bacteroidia bacterium]|nr:hypothetical protein [Bacteroidia bacterium]